MSPSEVTPLLYAVQQPSRKLPYAKRGIRYINCVCAFDIETYTFERTLDDWQAAMYIWQMQVDRDYTIIGRTWEEFRAVVDRLCEYLEDGEYVVVYVHNLSYEFQFLKSILPVGRVFARDRRKVVSFTSGHLEFRCSYAHSNMSLLEYTRKMQVAHVKLHDTVDYQMERWFDTPLEDDLIRYGAYDVMGVVEAIYADMEVEGDDLYTIPLTSTGYVRREAKKAMRTMTEEYRAGIKPPYEVYRLERWAFRGGDTHANRYYAGLILDNVHSVDISSSYPAAQCMREYPVGEWEEVRGGWPEVILMLKHRRPFLCQAVFYGVRLRDENWGCPYLSISKCRNLKGYEPDNGRVLNAEILETALTDVDMQILLEEYQWESVVVRECWAARYGRLPEAYVQLIQRYYRIKTELKGVGGQEVYYVKSKNKINSFYGMTAQNPVMDTYQYAGGVIELVERDAREAYEKSKPWMPYAWGVWCTAHARRALHEGIKLAGDGFVYCDTDSVKFIGDADFSAYNRRAKQDAEATGCVAEDKHGRVYHMGVYESDGSYSKFCTWGAKKYASADDSGRVQITVAGVNKYLGARELEEAGGITAFKPGFVFRAGGGLEAIYNDVIDNPVYRRPDGVEITIISNVALVPSTYTLGLADAYAVLLSAYNVDKCKDMLYNSLNT